MKHDLLVFYTPYLPVHFLDLYICVDVTGAKHLYTHGMDISISGNGETMGYTGRLSESCLFSTASHTLRLYVSLHHCRFHTVKNSHQVLNQDTHQLAHNADGLKVFCMVYVATSTEDSNIFHQRLNAAVLAICTCRM